MKYVCSQCGEMFDGVFCSNCGKKAEKPSVITVSRPEIEPEETEDYSFLIPEKDRKKQEREQKRSERRLDRQRARADRAASSVKKFEKSEAEKADGERERLSRMAEKELIKGDRAGRREDRIKERGQNGNFLVRLFNQFIYVIECSLSGKTRQAIHFVISPRGSLAPWLMIPLCALIPFCAAVAAVAMGGADGSRPGEVVSSFFGRLGGPFLKALAMWGELCAALIIMIIAHGFIIQSEMTVSGAVGLVMTAQLPALFLCPVFVVGLLIFPALSLFLAVLAVFQTVILLYIGIEYAARNIKKGVFTSFSVLLCIMIFTAAALAAINFDSAEDWIVGMLKNFKG